MLMGKTYKYVHLVYIQNDSNINTKDLPIGIFNTMAK